MLALIFFVIVSARPKTDSSSLLIAPLRLRVFFTLSFSASVDTKGVAVVVARELLAVATKVEVPILSVVASLFLLILRLIRPSSKRSSLKELVTNSSLSLKDLIRLIRSRLARLASF